MTDFGFLRTIPEDRSQVASSVAASNPSNGVGGGGNGDDATSVRAVEAGRDGGSGSVVSDAMATLAGGSSTGHNNNNNKKNSSVESGDRRGAGGTGGSGDGGGQARRGGGGGGGSGYDDAGSNIGVLPGTSDVSPRRGGRRRRPARDGHHHHHHHRHSKHASCLEKAFCYWPRSKRKKTCIWVLAILVVTAFVLCVVLLTTTPDRNPESSPIDQDDGNNNNNTGDEEQEQQSPSASLTTISPTASPTATATIPAETRNALDAILLTLTPAEILYPPSGFAGLGRPDQDDEYQPTPQAQARDWMLHDDLFRDEVLADGPARVLQRYSLVVFFISTQRPDYLDGTKEECQWQGIHCEAPGTISSGTGGGGGGGGFTGDLEFGGGGGGGDLDAVGGADVDDLSSSLGGTLQLVVRGIILPWSNLSGTLPSELRALTYLGELHIPDNNVTGVIPSEWFVLVPPPSTGSLEESTTLPPISTSTQAPIFTTPAVATEAPPAEPGLYSLFWFDASRNQLSGTIPPGLWSLPFLRFVYLGNNDLSGPLETLTVADSTATSPTYVLPTTDLGSSSNLVLSTLLEDIRLNDNRLSGTIPSWLLSRPTLRAIVANNNQFNGSLLSLQDDDGDDNNDSFSLDQAISLSALDLSNNSLTGPLPNNLFSTVAAYSTLHYLYLENNQFTGPLPIDNSTAGAGAGGNVVALMDVWLYNNNLQGQIPPGFAQGWKNLTELLLHDNPLLTGELEVPETTTTSAAPVAASTLAPGVVGTTPTNSSSLTSPSLNMPATCKSNWPLLERMTTDCNATPGETAVVCPCCTECY